MAALVVNEARADPLAPMTELFALGVAAGTEEALEHLFKLFRVKVLRTIGASRLRSPTTPTEVLALPLALDADLDHRGLDELGDRPVGVR